jgi:hypothetical protein
MNAALRLAPALTLLFAAGALAQAPPVPGPEHEILKRDVGVWDVVVEMLFPGAPPMTMSGVETNTLVAGRWLVSEFRAEMMGQAFEGRGITGWDPGKKVYTGVWVDSMGTSLNLAEASHDPGTNTLTGWIEMADPSGGKGRAKTETSWPAADTRLFKVFPPDGASDPFMKMTYTKRP